MPLSTCSTNKLMAILLPHFRSLVLLCTEDVSPAAREVLSSDGWEVRLVAAIPNPGRWSRASGHRKSRFPARFWAAYTKLHLFNLTEYERGDP